MANYKLLEMACTSDLPSSLKKILMVLGTLCFNQESFVCTITLNDLSKLTSLDRSNIYRNLTKLVDQNIIHIGKKGSEEERIISIDPKKLSTMCCKMLHSKIFGHSKMQHETLQNATDSVAKCYNTIIYTNTKNKSEQSSPVDKLSRKETERNPSEPKTTQSSFPITGEEKRAFLQTIVEDRMRAHPEKKTYTFKQICALTHLTLDEFYNLSKEEIKYTKANLTPLVTLFVLGRDVRQILKTVNSKFNQWKREAKFQANGLRYFHPAHFFKSENYQRYVEDIDSQFDDWLTPALNRYISLGYEKFYEPSNVVQFTGGAS